METSCASSDVNIACVQGSTNGTNGIPISFKVLPMVPLATNATIGKISNGAHWENPERTHTLNTIVQPLFYT